MQFGLHFWAVAIRRLAGTWRRAGIETVRMEAEWRYRRGLRSEVAKMEDARKAIEDLKKEMALVLTASPWAAEVAMELLEERLTALRPRRREDEADIGEGERHR